MKMEKHMRETFKITKNMEKGFTPFQKKVQTFVIMVIGRMT
jgi:hypothetical protein